MDYEDFELQLGPPVNGGYLVRVLQSPAGQGEMVLRLPEAAGPGHGRDLQLRTGNDISSTEIGGRLFRSLFTGAVGDLFLQSLSLVGVQRGLRIRLRINPRGEGLGLLHRQPWELLYREETDDFLALSRRTPVVRALDIARPVPKASFDPPLRILVVVSQDPGGVLLELGEELMQLRSALSRIGGAVLETLENPDARALREALDSRSFHVLHYMGHGSFDPVSGEGGLLLRGPDGKRELVTGRHLATKTKDVSSLRLVVLNACETALASASPEHNPFAGVAAALLLGGVPAVVAMQSAIADQHAIAFSTAFYRQIARGTPVDEAVTEGRQAIHSLHPDRGDWSIPVLFLRTPSGEVFSRSRGKPRTSTVLKSTGAVLALAILGSAPVLLNRLKPTAKEPVAAGEQKSQDSILAAGTPASQPAQIVPPKEEKPLPAASRSSAQPSGAGGSVRTMQVGKAGGGLRLEIAGARSFPGSFDAALRRELRQLAPESLSGWTLRLDPEAAQVDPVTEAGSVLQSCHLSLSGQLDGHGESYELGPVGQDYTRFSASSACDFAAAELAKSVVRRITPYVAKEGSR
jgi:hypothetical protein